MEYYELMKTIARSLLEDPKIYAGIIQAIPQGFDVYPEEDHISIEDMAYLWLLEQLEEIANKFKKEHSL